MFIFVVYRSGNVYWNETISTFTNNNSYSKNTILSSSETLLAVYVFFLIGSAFVHFFLTCSKKFNLLYTYRKYQSLTFHRVLGTISLPAWSLFFCIRIDLVHLVLCFPPPAWVFFFLSGIISVKTHNFKIL